MHDHREPQPCAFCGHPDQGHRVRDAIVSRARAGESIESLAEDYALSVEMITQILHEGPVRALFIPRWHPATKNQIRRGVRNRILLKRHDRDILWAYARQQQIPKATGKRRLTVHILLVKGQRASDVDAYFDSLLDGCKHAGLIVDDSPRYLELDPVVYAYDAEVWGTRIEWIDLPVAPQAKESHRDEEAH